MTYTENPEIARLAAEQDREESFDRDFPGWEERGARPEYRRFIPANEVDEVGEALRAEVALMDDLAAWEGMGS